MGRISVRCHAAVMNGRIYCPATVEAEVKTPTTLHDGFPSTVVSETPVRITETAAELHSTVCYNGVAIVGGRAEEWPVTMIDMSHAREQVERLAKTVSTDCFTVVFLPIK